MREAHRLASRIWPSYGHRCSRHDFTLPQLFACLIVREMMKLSYRKTEALLRDSPHWLREIQLLRPPDHNTLWRAFDVLVQTRRVISLFNRRASARSEKCSILAAPFDYITRNAPSPPPPPQH